MNPRFYTSAVATEHYLGIRWPKRIWLSVLEQAVADILHGPSAAEMKGKSLEEMKKMRLEYQAAAQFWVDDPVNEPRRFVWVCEQLGFDPEVIRRGIEQKVFAGVS